MTAASTSVSSVLTDVGTLVTQAQSWISSFAQTITETPILFIFVVVMFCGLAIGLIRRIISLG